MVPRKMNPRKKVARRRAPVRKAFRRKYGLVKGDVAQVTANLGSLNLGANGTYGAYNFSLSNSDRAKAVAQAYQFYRIRRVTVTVKPLYDTFTSGGTAAVPHYYHMVDRARNFQLAASLNTLKSAGAKPRRIDDKTFSYSFAPAVSVMDISSPSTGTGVLPGLQPGQYRISPWLPTNANANQNIGLPAWTPNSVDHAGILMAIEQWGTVTQTGPVCNVEFTVEYEFKKRLWSQAPSEEVTPNDIDLDTMAIVVPPEGLKQSSA